MQVNELQYALKDKVALQMLNEQTIAHMQEVIQNLQRAAEKQRLSSNLEVASLKGQLAQHERKDLTQEKADLERQLSKVQRRSEMLEHELKAVRLENRKLGDICDVMSIKMAWTQIVQPEERMVSLVFNSMYFLDM